MKRKMFCEFQSSEIQKFFLMKPKRLIHTVFANNM